jgi:hypothetical protein
MRMSETTRNRTKRISAVAGGVVVAPLMVLALSGSAMAATPPTIGQGIDQTLGGVKTTVGGVGTAVNGLLGSLGVKIKFPK